MTGQQLQTLGARLILLGVLVWVASFYLAKAYLKVRHRQAANVAQMDADWEERVAELQQFRTIPLTEAVIRVQEAGLIAEVESWLRESA